ncbi:MAG: hypothetical protein ACRDQA_26670 [Nocardioidaceae bacterium]
MSENIVEEIASVLPRAVKVWALSVTPGDSVFDVFGGRHEVTRVSIDAGGVTTTRADGVRDRFASDDTITVTRGHSRVSGL